MHELTPLLAALSERGLVFNLPSGQTHISRQSIREQVKLGKFNVDLPHCALGRVELELRLESFEDGTDFYCVAHPNGYSANPLLYKVSDHGITISASLDSFFLEEGTQVVTRTITQSGSHLFERWWRKREGLPGEEQCLRYQLRDKKWECTYKSKGDRSSYYRAGIRHSLDKPDTLCGGQPTFYYKNWDVAYIRTMENYQTLPKKEWRWAWRSSSVDFAVEATTCWYTLVKRCANTLKRNNHVFNDPFLRLWGQPGSLVLTGTPENFQAVNKNVRLTFADGVLNVRWSVPQARDIIMELTSTDPTSTQIVVTCEEESFKETHTRRFIRGKLHDIDGEPAWTSENGGEVVTISYEHGKPKVYTRTVDETVVKAYYDSREKLHRTDGPAIDTGVLSTSQFYREGKLVNQDLAPLLDPPPQGF